MIKPKVIIADEDINYIIPIQYKFVIDFFDAIELVIISDKNYFREYFSKPQSAEILIVSEELYDSSIIRHNIASVFVMTEEVENSKSEDINVNKLFKYTSIKEIFSKIIGMNSSLMNAGAMEKKETQIILITSAAGGVGKTTISMGVAINLSKNYKNVLYINASKLQHFQYLLNNQTTISTADVYAKLLNPTENIYSDIRHVIRKEGFNYLPAFKAALLSIGIDFGIYKKFALAAKKSRDYDFIIIDVENTFDENKTELLDIADKVIVITDQTFGSVTATNNLVSNINGIRAEKYIFVCNRFNEEKSNSLINPELDSKFSISEYIEEINFKDEFDCEQISQNNGIKKLSFLIL